MPNTFEEVLEIVDRRNEALAEVQRMEEAILLGLIDAKQFEFVSINWKRLQVAKMRYYKE